VGIRQHPPTGLFPELCSRYHFDWIFIDRQKNHKNQSFYEKLAFALPF